MEPAVSKSQVPAPNCSPTLRNWTGGGFSRAAVLILTEGFLGVSDPHSSFRLGWAAHPAWLSGLRWAAQTPWPQDTSGSSS